MSVSIERGIPPTPGELPAPPCNTPRGDLPCEVEEKVDPRGEPAEKPRSSQKVSGAIPECPLGWSQTFEENESGGFADEEPTLVRGLRVGFRSVTTIKGISPVFIEVFL